MEQDRKPYYGGYRHKNTGAEYHHACTQTMQTDRQREAIIKKVLYICIIFTSRTRSYVTSVSARQYRPTQRHCRRDVKHLHRWYCIILLILHQEKRGLHIDDTGDKQVVGSKYQSAEEVLHRRDGAAVHIQKVVRGMFARREARLKRLAHETYVCILLMRVRTRWTIFTKRRPIDWLHCRSRDNVNWNVRCIHGRLVILMYCTQS